MKIEGLERPFLLLADNQLLWAGIGGSFSRQARLHPLTSSSMPAKRCSSIVPTKTQEKCPREKSREGYGAFDKSKSEGST